MQHQATDSLLALSRLGATAVDQGELISTAMPSLRELVGAESALVVARSTEGDVLRLADGLSLRLADLVLPEVPDGLAPLTVPGAWAAAGIGTALGHLLPGHNGVLVLAWTDSEGPADLPLAEAAVSVLDTALARLDAEERLADLVLRVDSAQHLAGMGDYDWHIPSDTNRWSDQLFRIYGYEPQSFNATYERFLSNIHPEDRERIQAIHQRAYATGEPYQMIERILRPDGEVRYLSSNGEVIMEAGAPVRMRGTCIDITERVLAEQETERAAERFRGLVESSPEAILVLDSHTTILQANGRAADLLGGNPAGRALAEILPPESWRGAQGVAATTFDAQPLVLDLTTAELSESNHEGRTALFLQDARPRLEREAMATRLGESQQRRRQALEINDNVVQGLTSAVYSLEQDDVARASSFIARTLSAARNMMDDLLEPSGEELHPGDLVRSAPSQLDDHDPHPATAPDLLDDGASPLHRVLIVDDAADIRMLLRLRLGRQADLEVVGEAVDGVDAIDQARELQPHLVLLDMAMPRMDGLQALPLIRAAVPDVRVIVLSGFNQGTLEQEALAAGADRYIVKGGSMRDLLEEIAKVLQVA